MATPGSPSRGHHRRTLSTTNIALRSGSAVSGVLHLAAALWASLHVRALSHCSLWLSHCAPQFWRLSGVWATLFALPALSLAGTSVYINLRTRSPRALAPASPPAGPARDSRVRRTGKRELLTFSERKRTRTVIINFALSLIWAIACASTLWQVR